MGIRTKICWWMLVIGMTFGCSAAQTDSGELQVSSDEAVDNVVGDAAEYDAGNNENGQLLGMGGNVMNDTSLNSNLNTGDNLNSGDTVSGEEVTNAIDSAQAINSVAGSDEGNVLADGADVAEIEQPQNTDLYGNNQTQLDSNLNIGQMDNPTNSNSMNNVPSMDNEPMNAPLDGGAFANDSANDDVGMNAAVDSSTMTASLPEMGAKMVYVIKKGDTLGDIAQNIYGDKSKWRDLASWSGFANPHLIFPGDVVYYQYTQESASFAANYEAQQRMEEVVVQTGDSLSKIAAKVYGNPMAWIVLWRHNGHVANPDVIQVGMKIHYPTTSFLVADSAQAVPALDAALDTDVDQVDQPDQAEGQVASQAIDQVPAAG